jgi:hypothetical protein
MILKGGQDGIADRFRYDAMHLVVDLSQIKLPDTPRWWTARAPMSAWQPR